MYVLIFIGFQAKSRELFDLSDLVSSTPYNHVFNVADILIDLGSLIGS